MQQEIVLKRGYILRQIHSVRRGKQLSIYHYITYVCVACTVRLAHRETDANTSDNVGKEKESPVHSLHPSTQNAGSLKMLRLIRHADTPTCDSAAVHKTAQLRCWIQQWTVHNKFHRPCSCSYQRSKGKQVTKMRPTLERSEHWCKFNQQPVLHSCLLVGRSQKPTVM